MSPSEWRDREVLDKVRAAVMRGVIIAIEKVRADGNELIMSGAKTGRIYRRRGVDHQASAPGEPPASDTGRLVKSSRPRYEYADLTGIALWSTEYAAALELGTEKMAARPFARVALAMNQAFAEAAIAAEVAAALK